MEWTLIDEQKTTSYLVQVSQQDKKDFLFHIREINNNIDVNFVDENNRFLTPVPIEVFFSNLPSEKDRTDFRREHRNMSGWVLLEPWIQKQLIYVREMTKEEVTAFRYLEDTFPRDLMNEVKSSLM